MVNSEFHILVTVLQKQMQKKNNGNACNQSHKRKPKNF